MYHDFVLVGTNNDPTGAKGGGGGGVPETQRRLRLERVKWYSTGMVPDAITVAAVCCVTYISIH